MQVAQTQLTPAPPAAPAAPGVIITPEGRVQIMPGGGSPSAILEAFRNQRSELRNQLERLEEQREDFSQELRQAMAQPAVSNVDTKGLEQRIASIDTRIVEIEKQLSDADANVARAAAIPGAVVPPRPPPPREGPPEEFWVLSGIFMFVIGMPIAIAYARRIWRRSTGAISALPQEIYDRFNRLDQAVDAVAIEVERVGEGQRFLTRSLGEQQRALGAGPAERIEALERERERQARK
jgi:hypothetical protein